MTAFGVFFATQIQKMEGFQVVMEMLLMPSMLLSGALFRPGDLPGWLAGSQPHQYSHLCCRPAGPRRVRCPGHLAGSKCMLSDRREELRLHQSGHARARHGLRLRIDLSRPRDPQLLADRVVHPC